MPEELLALGERVTLALDTALDRARKASSSDAPEKHHIQWAELTKRKLLVTLISSLRDAGEIQRARAMANRHSAFLAEMGVSIRELLPESVPRMKP